jgi:hypothetical protein
MQNYTASRMPIKNKVTRIRKVYYFQQHTIFAESEKPAFLPVRAIRSDSAD